MREFWLMPESLALGPQGPGQLSRIVFASQQSRANDAAESDVACGRLDHLRMTGGGPVALAVVRGAQIGSAFDYLAWYANGRLTRIIAERLRGAARVVWHTARRVRIFRVPGGKPVRGPFPNVARHV